MIRIVNGSLIIVVILILLSLQLSCSRQIIISKCPKLYPVEKPVFPEIKFIESVADGMYCYDNFNFDLLKERLVFCKSSTEIYEQMIKIYMEYINEIR